VDAIAPTRSIFAENSLLPRQVRLCTLSKSFLRAIPDASAKGPCRQGFETGFTHNLTEGSAALLCVQRAGQRVPRRAIPSCTQRHALLKHPRSGWSAKRGLPCVFPGLQGHCFHRCGGKRRRGFCAFSTAFHSPHKRPSLCALTCPVFVDNSGPYPGASPRMAADGPATVALGPKTAMPSPVRPTFGPVSLEPVRDAT